MIKIHFECCRPRPASKAVAIVRQRIEYDLKKLSKSSTRKTYDTLEDAVAARIRNVSSYPGKQTISHAAALALVSR